MTKIVTITFLFYFLFSGSTPAQDVVWKKNFGSHGNNYESIITVSDGVVVVGRGLGFNFGDWEGVTGKGGSDAIIVKYNNNGNVIWKKNFGGEAYDTFFSVTEVPDGIVAVGYSSFFSFNTGDWEGIANKGGDNAIIVKYNHNGNVVWKKNFGGRGTTQFLSVATVPDGIVAVGYSTEYSFNNGDWEGITGNGDWDAIIVKYDLDGNVVWKKNFGGKKEDYFNSVASSSDGIIAVGNSDGNSFGNGDWVNINGKGVMDCILVKYDFNGNVVWKKNFGGVGIQGFYAVATTADGIVAAGGAYSHSFETGDWEGFTAKGTRDATIVKFDFAGNVVWKNNFGGNGHDGYDSVTEVIDGFVAVGGSLEGTFNSGDWDGISGYGEFDAIIVKYDKEGNVVWKNNFGGIRQDHYYSVTTISNSVIAVGYSHCNSFGSGNWEGIECRGHSRDAIIVKYADGEIGIDEPLQELADIRVFPNPTTGELTLEWTSGRVDGIEIYDIYGRQQKAESRKQKAEGEMVMNISELATGIYFVKIYTDKGMVTKKIIKH